MGGKRVDPPEDYAPRKRMPINQRKRSNGAAAPSSAIVAVDSRGRPLIQERVGAPTKYSPELVQSIIHAIDQWPNVTHACAMSGITYRTFRYWLNKSRTGRIGDGFDVEFEGQKERLHILYDDCLQTSVQRVEDAYLQRGIGYKEVLTDKGRVQYQYDEDLLRLGFVGFEAYLRDENGKPIPETVDKQDPETMLMVLRHYRPERWTTKVEMDVMHKGGVLVVGVRASSSEELTKLAKQTRDNPGEVEFREDVEDV